jgi:TPR repeat protein
LEVFCFWFFYKEGELVKQDFWKAVKWFTLSANQGDTEAQRDLGFCYFYGQGVKENHKKAVIWSKKLREKMIYWCFATWTYAVSRDMGFESPA